MQALQLPSLTFAQFAFASFAAIFGGMLAFLSAMKIIEEIFGVGKTAQAAAAAFQKVLDRPSFSRAYVSAAYLSELAFGSKLLSIRAFCVSCLASIFWLAVLCVANLWIYGSHSWFRNPTFLHEVQRNAWFFAPAGLLTDFLAVCLTRWMLLAALRGTTLRKLAILALNIALTALLFYVVYGTLKWLRIRGEFMGLGDSLQVWTANMFQLDMSFHFLHDVHAKSLGGGEYALSDGEALVDYMFPEGMLFAASLLTTFWFVAHVLAYWAYGAINKGRLFAKALVGESAIKSKPILSMAGIACIVTLLPVWILSLLFWAALN